MEPMGLTAREQDRVLRYAPSTSPMPNDTLLAGAIRYISPPFVHLHRSAQDGSCRVRTRAGRPVMETPPMVSLPV
jgi:hypothetical protein